MTSSVALKPHVAFQHFKINSFPGPVSQGALAENILDDPDSQLRESKPKPTITKLPSNPGTD